MAQEDDNNKEDEDIENKVVSCTGKAKVGYEKT